MKKKSINTWALEDRPREKLLVQGRKSLSDVELLSILLGSGNCEENAIDLSRRILAHFDNDLEQLNDASLHTLIRQFKGIGEAKAICIAAAMELGLRRKFTGSKEKIQISSSRDAHHIFAPLLMDIQHEEFWYLLLNRANKVTHREQLSKGGVAGTVVDPKLIFKRALEAQASGIILAHNHPSGNLKPSTQDINLTQQLRSAAKLLDMTVLDHLIIAEDSYFSFADEGML
ncbi:MAG: RadC family protein [Saprospiraceae bacterium]